MNDLEQELKQHHKDCEILKARNSTPEAQEEHERNSMRIYADLYFYYRDMGCSRKQSRKYALLTMENRLGIKTSYDLKEAKEDE
jgi:hypothetical protein